MSCAFCAHWRRDGLDSRAFDKGSGQCTRNPAWLETEADHYCGQMLLVPDQFTSGGTSRHLALWRRMGDNNQKVNEATREVTRLRKANKELRAKLREKRISGLLPPPET